MSHRILVNPGTPQSWEFTLHPGLSRVGSADDNDLRIVHPTVSPHHCEIIVSDAEVKIRDLDSAHGTFVERVAVKKFSLQHQHRLQLGAVQMIFESPGLPVLPDAVNLPADGAHIMVANVGPTIPPVPPRPPAPPQTTPSEPLLTETDSEDDQHSSISVTRGVIGALIGGILGAVGWFLLIKWTRTEVGYAALMVGALSGFGARLLSRGGNRLQGLVCSACAFGAIVLGQYLALNAIVDQELTRTLIKEYKRELRWAQSAVEATNRDDIVYFLSVRNDVSAGTVSEDDIKHFREVELPRFHNLLKGTPTESEYVAAEKAQRPRPQLSDSIGIFTLLWGLFGIAAAWRIGSSKN